MPASSNSRPISNLALQNPARLGPQLKHLRKMNNHPQSQSRLTSTLLSIRQGAIWKQKKTKRRRLMMIDTMQTELSTALIGLSPLPRFIPIMAAEQASRVRQNATPIIQITNRNNPSFMFQHILALLQHILLVFMVTGIQYLHSQQATRCMVSCVSSGSFLTLDCSHCRRQCLCTYLRVPLHSQGDMYYAFSHSSLTRHILHSLAGKSNQRGYRVIYDLYLFLCWVTSVWTFCDIFIVIIIVEQSKAISTLQAIPSLSGQKQYRIYDLNLLLEVYE